MPEANMTAIGFFMFVIGWVLVAEYGTPYLSSSMWNLCDKIGLFMVIVGFTLFNIGMFVHLWREMP